MTSSRYPDPDPSRFPVWPVGTWERALMCQLAGLPTDPASASALARHDSATTDPAYNRHLRQAAAYHRHLRTAIGPLVSSLEGPIGLEWFCLAVASAPAWEGLEDDVAGAVLGQYPVTRRDLEDTAKTGRGAGGKVSRFWTGTDHLVTIGAVRLQQYLEGAAPWDPLDPPESVLEDLTHAAASITPPFPGVEAPEVPEVPVRRPTSTLGSPRGQGVPLTPEERTTGRARAVELRGQGWTHLRIAQTVGVDRTTVRRWLREAAA